ncbi:acyl carrier protein [Sulfurifustis variabilis]|uniref:Acyl carrier protein n=1 Tax=Sulfurifustis variabilis TaxID=1675686 RepID=A0A1B4V4U0_9GAMM|nr:hypothetical protein [Sulfurifustis variabilis]BAU48568.1 acyl carrier protein [Sulfurifustis variabilis]
MSFSEQQVGTAIIQILRDMTQDWDLDLDDDIGVGTKLVEQLGFSSVDIIHLVVAVEEHFSRPRMGFDELLMREGRYVDDLSVSQVASFVTSKLNGVAA